MRLRFLADWKTASVCLFAEQNAAVPQRSMCRSEGRKRCGARRSGRRKPQRMRLLQWMQLVTIARFVKRNGHGREGEGADRQPVERSNPRDGHGAKGGGREVLES